MDIKGIERQVKMNCDFSDAKENLKNVESNFYSIFIDTKTK